MTHFTAPPPFPACPTLGPCLGHACHPRCALSIFKSDKCVSVLVLHVGILLVTVGLVQCPKIHCGILSNVAKALPP